MSNCGWFERGDVKEIDSDDQSAPASGAAGQDQARSRRTMSAAFSRSLVRHRRAMFNVFAAPARSPPRIVLIAVAGTRPLLESAQRRRAAGQRLDPQGYVGPPLCAGFSGS